MSEQTTQLDPCKEFGPSQKKALIWFFAVIIIGAALTWRLSKVDRWMYDNNGEYLNYEAYRDNRNAATSVAMEPGDPRKYGDITTAREKLSN